jgi:hypothetical protein
LYARQTASKKLVPAAGSARVTPCNVPVSTATVRYLCRYSAATVPPEYRYTTGAEGGKVVGPMWQSRGADVARLKGRVRRRRPLECPSSRRRTCADGNT